MPGKKISALLLAAIMTLAAASPYYAQGRTAPPPNKVIYVSLDGLAYHIWARDPVARELRSLRAIAARGVEARGVVQSFPTITPAGHAALWTGAYGNVSGIVTSTNPLIPRSEHTAFERESGYNSNLLQAEPLWVAAARQNIRTVAHHATQSYPFVPFVTASDVANPPLLVSGNGPPMVAPHVALRPGEVKAEDAKIWNPALPRSSLPVKAFSWTAGKLVFHAAMVAERGPRQGYTAMYISADPRGARVRVSPTPPERVGPRARQLARHFSAPLPIKTGDDAPIAVAYFRLFDLAKDGSDFLLYHPSVHEVALHHGHAQTRDMLNSLLAKAGGFIGNGPSWLYLDGKLGKPLYAGGDGAAERCYLEGMELVIRQMNRLSQWVWKRYSPDLLIDYLPYPDEMDHTWYGLVRPDVTGVDREVAKRFQEFRRWGYAAIDKRVALLDSLAGPRGHIVFSSDHGMSPTHKEVKVNVILQQAGLLAVDDKGQVVPSRTQAVHVKHFVIINTQDWRGGIVPADQRKKVVDQVERTLREVRDPETGQAVFLRFFRPEEYGDQLGIGGPAGGDIYFELAPGYDVSDQLTGDAIVRKRVAAGTHGFLSIKYEMLASFIARGPQIGRRGEIAQIRSIDIAPLVADILGINPPAQSRGRAPFQCANAPGPLHK